MSDSATLTDASSSRAGVSAAPGGASSSGRSAIVVAVPERFVFGQPWLDSSGLTFEHNDIHEVCAYRRMGRVRHVFPLESLPLLLGKPDVRRHAAILALVPEALAYVPSLSVGQAFPEPMRSRRVPPAPRHRVEEALGQAREIACRAGRHGRAPLVEMLVADERMFDREQISARLVGAPPHQVQVVLEQLAALHDVVSGHGSILQAAAFRTAWERVEEVVLETHAAMSGRLRWLNDGLSYALGFLKEIMAAPRERIVAQLDQATVELRRAVFDGELGDVRSRQFEAWRECRRIACFYQGLASLWDMLDFEDSPRASVEALVRSTICRVQYFK